MKPLKNQVIVITGASSGVGLRLAQQAAAAGAKLVLVARSNEHLKEALLQLDTTSNSSSTRAGSLANPCDAIAIVADVTQSEEMEFVAREAITRFGHIDTWVNNAGVSTQGKLMDTHLSQKRRIFETNFWGMLHGCRAALPYLRDTHGTILNLGSSDVHRSIYYASKHAVQGYSDALRYELDQEQAGVQVKCLDVPAEAHSDWIVAASIEAIEERTGALSQIIASKFTLLTGMTVMGLSIAYFLRRNTKNAALEELNATQAITDFQNRNAS
jgi:short-subunit dehydrogenase